MSVKAINNPDDHPNAPGLRDVAQWPEVEEIWRPPGWWLVVMFAFVIGFLLGTYQ